ncbi:unnamed protein product [Lymnaea stagnalis]|uniref:Carboxylic ester hydrolase n=1 Tax=Lymnaea stagnalis TaxID=6523 RepID=A0AAV2II08_LYMST
MLQGIASRTITFVVLSMLVGGRLCLVTTIESIRTNSTTSLYQGNIKTKQFDHETYYLGTFLGIPYARPSAGRFSRAEPIDNDNLTQAFDFQNICYQKVDPTNECQRGRAMSEDCLYLNVYTPLRRNYTPPTNGSADHLSNAVSGAYPVYVFIHGGAFFRGNGNCYDPSTLAAFGEIIVVTVNYRLGPFGFATTSDDVISGNMGLWDQHEALKWVNRHIREFGGDPKRVTLGGQSAGSYSALFQALYEGNDDLFQRVIAQSGTPAARKSINTRGYATTLKLARAMSCKIEDPKNSAEINACLINQNATDLAEKVISSLIPSSLPFQPTLEREFVTEDVHKFLTASARNEPTDPKLIPANFTKKDLLIGFNAEDGEVFYRLWAVILNDKLVNDSMRQDAIHRTIDMNLLKSIIFSVVAESSDSNIDDYAREIEAIMERYVDWENPDLNRTSNQAVKLLTDVFFAVPVVDTALSRINEADSATTASGTSERGGDSEDGSTFVYRFRLPNTNPRFKETTLSWFEGTEHSAEIPYVFGWVSGSEEVRLSKQVMTYWSNFIKTGHPNTPATNNDVAETEWKKFTATEQSYLEISATSEMKGRLVASSRHFWRDFLPSMTQHYRESFDSGVQSVKCPPPGKSNSGNDGDRMTGSGLVLVGLLMAIELGYLI